MHTLADPAVVLLAHFIFVLLALLQPVRVDALGALLRVLEAAF